jgi:HEPN domain-containing protein
MGRPEAVERAREVAAWLTKAAEDLRAASLDLGARPPLLADAGFHCQQAVEKTMKGLFIADAQTFGKSHDLRALGDRLVESHPELEAHVDAVAELTEYAWRFRYPGDLFEPPVDEVHSALAVARAFVAAVAAICDPTREDASPDRTRPSTHP